MKRGGIPCLALLAAFFAAGCAAQKSRLTSEDFPARAGGLKKIGVVVAEAQILGVREEGGSTLDTDASKLCAERVEAALRQALGERGYEAVAIAYDDEVRALVLRYLEVREEVVAAFPSDTGRFRRLPPLAGADGVCAQNGLDGIVFAGARDQLPPGGRKIVFWDMAVFRIFSGKGLAVADLSAADRAGKLLFYEQRSGDYPLTEEESVQKVFGELAAGLPRAGGK